MPQQTLTVNGHVYVLNPLEQYTPYPDYVANLQGSNIPCGRFRWAGNGETHFNYQAYDVLDETLGIYDTLADALAALDAELYPDA